MRGAGVRVLIVGAGIAGLATARTLHGWGAQVEIVERDPAPTTEGTGIYLPGNTVRALTSLGLSAPGRPAGGTHSPAKGRRPPRTPALRHRDADLWNGVGACLALHRATLHQVLLAGADAVPVRWGQTTQAITVDEHGVAPHRADRRERERGLKLASLVGGMVAGADSIDEMALCGTAGWGRCSPRAYAPSTLGSFLRTFTFGHTAS